MPFLSGLINKIQARKKRDNIILGGVIGACLIFIFLYILL